MIQPPPVCTGTGTLMADFSPVMTSLPSHGLCGICGQRVPVFLHDFTLIAHPFYAPATPAAEPDDAAPRVAQERPGSGRWRYTPTPAAPPELLDHVFVPPPNSDHCAARVEILWKPDNSKRHVCCGAPAAAHRRA